MVEKAGICAECGKKIALNEKRHEVLDENNSEVYLCNDCYDKYGVKTWSDYFDKKTALFFVASGSVIVLIQIFILKFYDRFLLFRSFVGFGVILSLIFTLIRRDVKKPSK